MAMKFMKAKSRVRPVRKRDAKNPLSQAVLDKLDEYLKQSRRRFNRNLKLLAKELGLPESQQDISIYTARHSFAMTLQNKGKSVEIISQALGHQSVETTKHYLAKFSTTKMAEETDIDLSE